VGALQFGQALLPGTPSLPVSQALALLPLRRQVGLGPGLESQADKLGAIGLALFLQPVGEDQVQLVIVRCVADGLEEGGPLTVRLGGGR
jgi:hypothetical protein